MVNHLTLGRVNRIFCADYKMEMVYYWIGSLAIVWIGSLAIVPELFELVMTRSPGSYIVLDPNDPISKCEKQIIMMKEVDVSNFTIDVFSDLSNEYPEYPALNNIPGPSKVALPGSSSLRYNNQDKKVRCPVCAAFQPVEIIKEHAAFCAEQKFPVILSSGEDFGDDDDGLPMATQSKETSSFSIESVKQLLNGCVPSKDSLKLRVTRGSEFDSFVDRFSESWVQKKIGSDLVVHFVGEAGVDQGGPKREFFCGMYGYLSL